MGEALPGEDALRSFDDMQEAQTVWVACWRCDGLGFTHTRDGSDLETCRVCNGEKRWRREQD